MTQNFLRTLLTAPVLREQEKFYGKIQKLSAATGLDRIGEDEAAFIQSRDSFYLGSVNPDGWPYIQHRGGPAGFLHVRDPGLIAFADFSGNRQLISAGNLATNDRVTLFLMDYPTQTRLKILGHAEIVPAISNDVLAQELTPSGMDRDKVERLYTIRVTGLSWNCPQYITPRFTAEEIESAVTPLREQIQELEREIKVLRAGPKPPHH